MNEEKKWNVKSSIVAKRTSNPIRQIVDKLNKKDIDPRKELIQLDIGDPTVFGNLKLPNTAVEAVTEALKSGKWNGYAHSAGHPQVRLAVAKKFSYGYNLTEEDVLITSACSGALDIVVTGIANEGENILIPSPGFSLYQTLCDSKGIQARCYKLLPEKNWEVDIEHMKSLIDSKTRAILVNNPSNPCGCVYSKEHLEEIIKVAETYCIPIIADEIYANMTFKGYPFHAMASISDNVPIISVGGLAKQYIVPGWRIGWIIIYDKHNYLKDLRDGFLRLSTLILGASTLVQSAVHKMLHETPEDYYHEVIQILQENAEYAIERISKIKGLKIIKPRGAMYLMVGIKLDMFDASSGIIDDLTFSQKLLKEESVSVLPGQCFRIKNFFRIVFCSPIPKLNDAFDRLENMCQRYLKK